jgi:hypothetical protein
MGLERLRSRRPWSWLSGSALSSGIALVALLLAPALLPAATRWFASGFFPPHYAWPERAVLLREVLADAARGGTLAVAVGALAWAVVRGRLAESRGRLLVPALVAADLLRAGSGLNPMVAPGLLRPSAEVSSLAQALREAGGRIFTPDIPGSPAYLWGRAAHPRDHELWTFGVLVDTATPLLNLGLSLPSALSIDLTMLVPTERVLSPEMARPGKVAAIVPALRNAGVSHVLSLDVLEEGDLRLAASLAPPRIAPLRLHVYAVEARLPLRSVGRDVVPAASRGEALSLSEREGFQQAGGVAVEGPLVPATGIAGRVVATRERPGRIDADVVSDRPSVLFVRDAYAPGWRATVDGRPAPLFRANGRHRAVPIPGGRSRVTLSYAPPGLQAGLIVSVLSLLAALALVVRSRQERPRVTR